jgi:hypothetical protein
VYHFGTAHQSKIQDFSSIHLASRVTIKEDKCGKEKCMPNDFENRVLVRRNARQVSAEEYQEILEKGKTQMTQLPSMPFHPDF